MAGPFAPCTTVEGQGLPRGVRRAKRPEANPRQPPEPIEEQSHDFAEFAFSCTRERDFQGVGHPPERAKSIQNSIKIVKLRARRPKMRPTSPKKVTKSGPKRPKSG